VNHILFRAIRIVVRADSDPARQVLFANLMQARLIVRLAYRMHGLAKGTWASALLSASYGFAYVTRIAPPGNGSALILAAAKHVNARRQIQRVAGWMEQDQVSCVRTKTRLRTVAVGVSDLASPRSWHGYLRALDVVRTVDRRHGFLVACRVAAAIAWYARTKGMLISSRPGAVLVSSDSNPEEVGLAAAAQAVGIPRVFVSHAYPTPFSPALDFSLSILEGAAAVQARRRTGPIKGDVMLAGIEGESAPLDPGRFERPNPVIGIFTPKALSWTTLAAIVADCRERFRAARIVIRWHPSRLDTARRLQSLGDLSALEESPVTATLSDVARQCDWVIADENSNVHLPVLKLGIPTVAVRRLGLYPDSHSDMYGFVAARIVFPSVQSVRDVSPEAFKAFFADGWVDRFRRYDAAYLRPQVEVGAEVRLALERLISEPPEKARCA
jgi:hypothetical protein